MIRSRFKKCSLKCQSSLLQEIKDAQNQSNNEIWSYVLLCVSKYRINMMFGSYMCPRPYELDLCLLTLTWPYTVTTLANAHGALSWHVRKSCRGGGAYYKYISLFFEKGALTQRGRLLGWLRYVNTKSEIIHFNKAFLPFD